MADAAGGAVDHHFLPRPDFAMVAKALECGHARHWNRGRFFERKIRRLQRQNVNRHPSVFGKTALAAVEEIGIDVVAGG